ncbi:hypothetical protein Cgig2_003120 [Carnegiea gigantea]|uniref:Uncharacterized protein n=1 Tax=Carnegiea gigantea TaxID=171969 RepID=A0A9Q1GY52_9CARY|nr:hypothetical protein Cgig2_003120 [Carnegiea gigantea]
MDWTLGNEKALLQNGQECDYGPDYRCSSSLQGLNVKKVRVKYGTLCYRRNDEKKCVYASKDYESYFNATVLKKVNAERHGQETYRVEEEFNPSLYTLLTGKGIWVVELLRVHVDLCEFHKLKHIYYDIWLDNLYREYLIYFAYGEQTDSEKEKFTAKKMSPVLISHQE